MIDKKLATVCDYLNEDHKSHELAGHKWNLDAGKLQAALEAGQLLTSQPVRRELLHENRKYVVECRVQDHFDSKTKKPTTREYFLVTVNNPSETFGGYRVAVRSWLSKRVPSMLAEQLIFGKPLSLAERITALADALHVYNGDLVGSKLVQMVQHKGLAIVESEQVELAAQEDSGQYWEEVAKITEQVVDDYEDDEDNDTDMLYETSERLVAKSFFVVTPGGQVSCLRHTANPGAFTKHKRWTSRKQWQEADAFPFRDITFQAMLADVNERLAIYVATGKLPTE